ncbi:MAG: DNA mismatch repair protein MutS [Ruminococcus sp.]|nr:DNA mismatch repair protein MutS [Ruminococcus sp.]
MNMNELKEAPDLLYPDARKRDMLNRRRFELNEKYPMDFLDNLMTETVARAVCHRNPNGVMKLFREVCNDIETAEYRLDALEDVMNCPKLSPAVHKAAREILESEHKGLGGMSPDSFGALGAAAEALGDYIDCMEELHGVYGEIKGSLRSKAFGRFFGETEERYNSAEFAEMKRDVSELREVLSKRIRSVTVAINFNEDMKPTAAGIVGISEKAAGERPGVFDRIFYKNAARPDTYVLGKMRRSEKDGQAEGDYVREVDKALFAALEKITGDYLARLRGALASFERLSFESVSRIDEQLDIYDGMARIVMSAESRGLKMCRPVLREEGRNGEIKGLFDPCFFLKAAAASPYEKGDGLVVRNDISFDEKGRFYILTGPNNGGKTTFVRGAGLCFLMGMTGFYVTAEKCDISLCDFIFTHFPKEEETGINASRFTTEIKDMKRISGLATEKSLLLMNESIQSTTPTECAEIAEELVRIFCIIGVRGIFATHITETAKKCGEIGSDPDCKSLPVSIRAAAKEGKRLYRIERGEPMGSSLAKDIFREFGISAEEIRNKKVNS